MKLEQPLAPPAPAGVLHVLPAAATTAAPEPAALVVSPFIHYGPDRAYNPLSDEMLELGQPAFEALCQVMAGLAAPPQALRELRERHWVVPAGTDLSQRFLLKYVSLEAHTVCNQACYFCPVSVAPREDYFMPTALYERIVGELAAFRDTIEAVFMISYNEPTLDKRFVEQVRTIRAAGLPPAALTNGTGLSADRIDALVAMGGLRFLSINLSTLDADKYREDRGGDHLRLVLRNLDYAKDKPVAEQMDMVVLGTGDERHRSDFAEIEQRFAGSRFNVKYFVVNDRAGYLNIGLPTKHPGRKLRGCDHVGSRPLQHLHINPRGQCILCCQDYSESEVVGDLTANSVQEVLTGPAMAHMRRMVYGLEPAPDNFICRNCKFALLE
ncbi:MAG TPA: radical SAM/SPASM domain-containing protein [Thermoanaerobaculia bacterium]|nr:radical SAM/SPASM domain-containing protein [Thermoanaerobaculia bacterium]